MATFIFLMSRVIFEPVSILILIKTVSWWKNRYIGKQEKQPFNKTQLIQNSLIATLLIVVLNIVSILIYSSMTTLVPNGNLFADMAKINARPSLEMASLMEIMSINDSFSVICYTLVISFFLLQSLRQMQQSGKVFLGYSGLLLAFTFILTLFSIFLEINVDPETLGPWGEIFYLTMPLRFVQDTFWQTGTPVVISDLFPFQFLIMRTALLNANLDGNIVLLILAYPFYLLRAFVNFALWGFFLFYIKKDFRTFNLLKENQLVDQTTYSSFSETITWNILKNFGSLTLFVNYDIQIPLENKTQLQPMIEILKNSLTAKELLSMISFAEQANVVMFKLLMKLKYISWWTPEFSNTYERAQLSGLYTLYSDGRDLLYYNFSKEKKNEVDPGLVSGMFSAITSFIQETTKSTDLLRTIDNGNTKVILEYSKKFPIFAAIFSNKETIEIRTALQNFIKEFENSHSKVLGNWNGDMSFFDNDKVLVEKYFKDFI
jgi:hypothetical protein